MNDNQNKIDMQCNMMMRFYANIYKPKTIQLNFTLTTIDAVSSKVIQYNNKMQTNRVQKKRILYCVVYLCNK